MMNEKWRTGDDQEEHERLSNLTAKSFDGAISRVSQAEKDNCDLNVLVRRFGIAPLMAPVDPARYGVFDGDLDLRSALQVVADAESAFMSLPAEIRERFKNDPLELLAAVQDESRADELRELGVFRPLPAESVAAESSGGSPPEAEGAAEGAPKD